MTIASTLHRTSRCISQNYTMSANQLAARSGGMCEFSRFSNVASQLLAAVVSKLPGKTDPLAGEVLQW